MNKDFIDPDVWWVRDLREFCRDNPPIEGVDYIVTSEGGQSEAAKQAIAESMTRLWAEPGVRERRSAVTRAALNRPETKERHRVAVKAAMNLPGAREAQSARALECQNRPETKERKSASLKAAFSTPEARARRSEMSRKISLRPDVNAARRASLRAHTAKPEIIEQLSLRMKKQMTCPHCGKVSNVANIKRWHMDRCKSITV